MRMLTNVVSTPMPAAGRAGVVSGSFPTDLLPAGPGDRLNLSISGEFGLRVGALLIQYGYMNWYRCLVEECGEDTAFYQTYWSEASHIGAAVEQVLAAAREAGLIHATPTEIDLCGIDDIDSAALPDKQGRTFRSESRFFFEPEGPSFRLPYGVIGASGEGGRDVQDIETGYAREKDDSGKTTISVNVSQPDLIPLYAKLLEAKPVYRVFWHHIHQDWEDGADHFLVNEALSTPAAILEHLSANPLDSLLNGHVTLTAYLEEGATNLNISEHKQIVIHTVSEEIADFYQNLLEAAGYPGKDDLVSVTHHIYHWHYRHPDARDREDLVKHLHAMGFTDWER